METRRNLKNFCNPNLFFFFFIVISCCFFQICHGAESIVAGQSILGAQRITSAGDNFILGFFIPGNSSYKYLGIWYKKVSPNLYVWVANTDNPLPASSIGVLKFRDDGNLNLFDNTTGKIYWSTNATADDGSQGNHTTAELLDSGNLILRRTSNITNTSTPVWQSFDHPSDVLIPGMKIGVNLKTGQEWHLKSWVDISNPAFGGFVMGLDTLSFDQIVVQRRGVWHWRSGPWNGERFDGVVEMNRSMYNYSLIREGDETYFSFSVYDESVISMMIFDSNGKIQQLTWNKDLGHWGLIWAHPKDPCDVYGLCGAFGTCGSGPSCRCLHGFQPNSPKNWSSNDWSGGCFRRTALTCGKMDKFLKVAKMRLPDRSEVVAVSNDSECETRCLADCGCTAYARPGSNQCRIWSGDLIDLEEVASGGHDVYIRLDESELGGTKKWVLAIIIVAGCVVMILLLGRTIFLWCREAKDSGMWKKSHDRSLFDIGATMSSASDSAVAKKLRDDDDNSGPELPLFDFATVADATENFSAANKLGEGGFGPVYKGKLLDGQEIAVKRLARSSGQGLEEFKNEVVLLSKLQHRNLVRVLGCCIQGEEKILIYEYMNNKSLDCFLFEPTKRPILGWAKSFYIVEGIAQGLLYLHQYSRLRIVHRDLKASNVLLDGEMNPKISDFGMARLFGGNQTMANTERVVGTYGYMAPEYAIDGQFSVKSDIYSFGVLLLEIISGKKNTGFRTEETSSLLAYAWLLWKDGRSLELLDPSLGDSCPTHEVLTCIHVGLLCVQEEAGDRPTMSTVVLMLGSDSANLPEPKKPGFAAGKNIDTTDSSYGTSRSVNSVTITMVEGR